MAVRGLDRLKRQLRALPAAQLEAAARALSEGAEDLAQAIKRATPVHLPGAELRDSVGWAYQGQERKTSATGAISATSTAAGNVKGAEGLAVTVYAGDDDAFYARWVEFGTQAHSLAKGANTKNGKKQGQGDQHPGARPSPFFFPTGRARRKGIKSRMVREANKAVKRAVLANGRNA